MSHEKWKNLCDQNIKRSLLSSLSRSIRQSRSRKTTCHATVDYGSFYRGTTLFGVLLCIKWLCHSIFECLIFDWLGTGLRIFLSHDNMVNFDWLLQMIGWGLPEIVCHAVVPPTQTCLFLHDKAARPNLTHEGKDLFF